jgi:hypothetical protein
MRKLTEVEQKLLSHKGAEYGTCPDCGKDEVLLPFNHKKICSLCIVASTQKLLDKLESSEAASSS